MHVSKLRQLHDLGHKTIFKVISQWFQWDNTAEHKWKHKENEITEHKAQMKIRSEQLSR